MDCLVNPALNHVFFFHIIVSNAGSDTGRGMYNLRSSIHHDHEMETALNSSSLKPEAEMVTENPLYGSAGLTGLGDGLGATQGASNPLYEATSLAGVGSAGAIANPLYESTCSLPGVSGAPAVANPLYEATPTEKEMTGEVNYGVNDDEDGNDEKCLR